MFNLGLAFKDDVKATKANGRKACDWFQKAAKLGHSGALMEMGRMRMSDDWGMRDIPKALALARRAARKGNAEAMTGMGFYYHNKKYGVEDFKLAVEWYRRGAAHGDSYAAYCLGLCAFDGEGMKKSARTGRAWMKKAFKMGEKRAKKYL